MLPGCASLPRVLLLISRTCVSLSVHRYVQAELVHCRFAMLAVAGILFPELAASIGIKWPGAGVAWYDAGKFEYFAPANALFGVQMLLFAWAELRR